jgi:hypothetical protein
MAGRAGVLLAFGPSASIPGLKPGWDDFQDYCNRPGSELSDAARIWREYDLKRVTESFINEDSASSFFDQMLSAILSGNPRLIEHQVQILKVNGSWVTTVFVPLDAIAIAEDTKWPPTAEDWQGLTTFFAFADGREWILWRGATDDDIDDDRLDGPHRDYRAGLKAIHAGDLATAERFLRRAAEAGDNSGQHNLALMYYLGKGVSRDLGEAAVWFRKASEQGHPVAQYNLAASYADGLGVPMDKAKAAFWYQRAASTGMPEAINNLGLMYANGDGVPRDHDRALSLFLGAAELGNPSAQQSAAAAHISHQNSQPNPVEALKWLEILSLRGFQARDKERLESLMTTEEIRLARHLAAQWLARFQTEVQRQ